METKAERFFQFCAEQEEFNSLSLDTCMHTQCVMMSIPHSEVALVTCAFGENDAGDEGIATIQVQDFHGDSELLDGEDFNVPTDDDFSALAERMRALLMRHAVKKHLEELHKSVSALSACYGAFPQLNDIQPKSASKCYAMSLDEWALELHDMRDEFDTVL